ncbi:MAG: hypothetical protein KBD01_17125 [Acidobacteria bacterium]|nr:hypothetical protein [Acidobacteriota bacterium]
MIRRRGLAPWLALAGLVAVFGALAWTRRWYNDDVFITFRYAENLARGFGFVWNTVEPVRVEGSTSLGWTFLNALAIRAGLDPLPFSQLAGLTTRAAGLVLVYAVARRWFGLPRAWALLAPAILFAGRQWVLWSVSAMEAGTATVLALAGTALLAREAEGGARRAWRSGAVFFVGTLFRPEMPLLHLAAGVGAALGAGPRSRRAVVVSGAVHAAGLAALVAGRLAYFGHPLPNTFYAKVGALQLAEGLRYLGEFAWQTAGLVWLPLAALGFVVAWRGGGRARVLAAAFAAQALALAAWVAALGGDAWEFRFLDPLLPGIALLAALAPYALYAAGRPLPMALAGAGAALLVATQAATLVLPFREFGDVASAHHMRQAADGMLLEARALAPYLGPQDRIATGWAGALPYRTRAWHFDPWGLNDPEIARRPFDADAKLFHQRVADWDDVVRHRVMFCDIFNAFLHERPYPPNQVPLPLMPWAREGVMVFGVDLPRGPYPFWIFASPRPVDEVRAWLAQRGLTLRYAIPLRLPPSRPAPR